MKNKLKLFFISVPTGFLLLPLISFAQNLGKTNDLAKGFQGVMNTLIVIATLFAFLFFVWGIANFIRHADEPAGREAGRQQMIWGIVALAVLVSIWGIVRWLQSETLGEGYSGGIGGILQMFGLGGGDSCPGCNPGEDGFGNPR